MAQQDKDENACPSQYPRDHQSTQETKLQAMLNTKKNAIYSIPQEKFVHKKTPILSNWY